MSNGLPLSTVGQCIECGEEVAFAVAACVIAKKTPTLENKFQCAQLSSAALSCVSKSAKTAGAQCAKAINDGLQACKNRVKNAFKCTEDKRITVGPVDPNEKVVVAPKFIEPDQVLVYPIHFENIGNAEAQDVFVTDVLDQNLDDSTLEN